MQDAIEVGGIEAFRVAEILAGAEAAAGAGQHDHPCLVLASVTAAVISRRIVAFSPFMTSGRLRVMVAMSPSWLSRIVW